MQIFTLSRRSSDLCESVNEEDELKYSEVVEKARETGGIGMIISEILCLFSLQKLHILLAPLSFSPLHV